MTSGLNHTPVIASRYLLVHGGWHANWVWERVALRLSALGHTVSAPDLPGHGKNKCDFKAVNLKSYVRHVEDIIQESPDPIVLVGHSMGGVVVTQVAENMPEKIKKLVYISGFIPENGGCLVDEERKATVPSVSLGITIDPENAAIRLTASKERIREFFYEKCSEQDVARALSLLQPQPLQPFFDPITTSKERFGEVPKLYIRCLQDKAIMLQDQHRMYSRVKTDIADIDTDHSPFYSAEPRLIGLLIDAGSSSTEKKEVQRFFPFGLRP